ncbi:MAG: hypothetical protein ACRDK5_01820 [Solirubrobacterales bacterium]
MGENHAVRPEAVAEHFSDDAVHYFTRLGPHRGREIAENAEWAVKTIDGQWWLEPAIESGDGQRHRRSRFRQPGLGTAGPGRWA